MQLRHYVQGTDKPSQVAAGGNCAPAPSGGPQRVSSSSRISRKSTVVMPVAYARRWKAAGEGWDSEGPVNRHCVVHWVAPMPLCQGPNV